MKEFTTRVEVNVSGSKGWRSDWKVGGRVDIYERNSEKGAASREESIDREGKGGRWRAKGEERRRDGRPSTSGSVLRWMIVLLLPGWTCMSRMSRNDQLGPAGTLCQTASVDWSGRRRLDFQREPAISVQVLQGSEVDPMVMDIEYCTATPKRCLHNGGLR